MNSTRKMTAQRKTITQRAKLRTSVFLFMLIGLALTGLNALPALAQQTDEPVIQTFPAGHGPTALASDGANIWIANQYDNTVVKLRASDGTLQGTFPVGPSPIDIIYDGANFWIANSTDGTVTKLRGSDGANLGTFTIATTSRSLA
jgi:DNA-binding beta-propeller fold protein YncE